MLSLTLDVVCVRTERIIASGIIVFDILFFEIAHRCWPISTVDGFSLFFFNSP